MLLVWMTLIVTAALANPQDSLNTLCEQLNTTSDQGHLSPADVLDFVGGCIGFVNMTATNLSVSSPNRDIDSSNNVTNVTMLPQTTVKPEPAWLATFYRFRVYINGMYVPAVVFFGIIGNAITLSVLRKDVLQSSSTIYLMGMTVADIIHTIILSQVIFMAYPNIRTSLLFRSANGVLLVHITPIGNICVTASVWITISFTVDRFIAVNWPMKAKEFCTKRRARFMTIGVYIFSIALNAIRFFFRYTIRMVDPVTQEVYFWFAYTHLGRNSTVINVTFWLYFIIVEVIPFCLLACLNSAIIWCVWRAQRTRLTMGHNDSKENKGNSRETQVTRVLICLVMASLVCRSFSGLFSIWVAMNGRAALVTTRDPYLFYILTFRNAFNLTNPLINCILYVVCSSTMREAVKAQLCLAKKANGKRTTTKTSVLSKKSDDEI